MKNIILKSLLQLEEASNRSSSSPNVSKVLGKPCRSNDDWCVIAADGSTSIITCKSASSSSKANSLDQTISDDPRAESKTNDKDLPDAIEPGVDLCYLDVEKETASKLIAGMHAMTVDMRTTTSRGEIAMPSAKTDIQEIFKTDKICMINPPKKQQVKNSGILVQESATL